MTPESNQGIGYTSAPNQNMTVYPNSPQNIPNQQMNSGYAMNQQNMGYLYSQQNFGYTNQRSAYGNPMQPNPVITQAMEWYIRLIIKWDPEIDLNFFL
jgi:hypothetical protein